LSTDLAQLQQLSESALLIPQLKLDLEAHERAVLELNEQLSEQIIARETAEKELRSRDVMIALLQEERAADQLTQREECDKLREELIESQREAEAAKTAAEERDTSLADGPSPGDKSQTQEAKESETESPTEGGVTDKSDEETDSRIAALEAELLSRESRIAELEAQVTAQQQELVTREAVAMTMAMATRVQPQEETVTSPSVREPSSAAQAVTEPSSVSEPVEQVTDSAEQTVISEPPSVLSSGSGGEEAASDQASVDSAAQTIITEPPAAAAISEPPAAAISEPPAAAIDEALPSEPVTVTDEAVGVDEPSVSEPSSATSSPSLPVTVNEIPSHSAVSPSETIPLVPPPALASSAAPSLVPPVPSSGTESAEVLLLRAQLAASELRSQELLKKTASLLHYVHREVSGFHREAMEIQTVFYDTLEEQQTELDDEAIKTRLRLLEAEQQLQTSAAAPPLEPWYKRLFHRKG
jgi:uncharacterized coiled-coil protein SlyX